MEPLLSTAYLPPIEYFAFFLENVVWLEYCENFQKQSFRTRAVILSASGPQTLSVPVVHTTEKMPIREARLDYDTPWQRTHWRTIETAYGSSPYFLYYKDMLRPFFEERFEYLFEYNTALTQTLLKLLNIKSTIRRTEEFLPIRKEDLRTVIHPRRKYEPEYPFYYREPYYQVFGDRFGFTPNLSVIDLLFNVGPEAEHYLQAVHKQITFPTKEEL